jgi:hypothetical protein
VRLTDVVPGDIGWIDQVIDRWDGSSRWSLRGQTPPLPLMWALLWDDVATQQTVRDDDGHAVALFQLAHVNLHDGVAELAMLADPEHVAHLGPLATAFLARVFRDFPLRKVTFGVATDERSITHCFGPRAQPSGRLRQHRRRGGDVYADVELYEMWGGSR